ncbi:uncharacterized protein LOC120340498 [Styela clava]|uniref:uncharacterized protein LOC120340498 n=1 Tax=Styela clava TaxID=7725 RepID=UPI00193A3E4B|nr:uncharacterized protein LOC120340498 [Styela clava]
MSIREKSPSPPLSLHPDDQDEDPATEEMFKMRMGASPHHTNPRSRTLVAWKETMPIEDYRYVRQQKRKQKNVPTTMSDYKEQHLIIAHRLAEMEKRRVGTRYLPKDQAAHSSKKKSAKDSMADCVIS